MPAPCLPVLLALVASAPDPSATAGAATTAATTTPTTTATTADANAAPAEALPLPPPADVSTTPTADAAPPPAEVLAPPPGDLSFGTAPVAARKPPPEHGPFFVGEPPSDTSFPNGPRPAGPPRFSLGRGAFCFVDDSGCKSSLILTADVGIGVNIVSLPTRLDVPYAQYNFRGGLVFKPMLQLREGGWHPWGIGLVGSWSRGTAAPTSKSALDSEHTDAWRIILVNQLWLSKKRNGFHLDLDLGLVRSNVLGSEKKFFGSHAGVSANWGGLGGLFLATDLLDNDTRIVFGFRGHGVAAAPIIAMVLLGLLAGGAL